MITNLCGFDAGEYTDPDKDGVPNLLEYSNGGIPTGSSSLFTPISVVTLGGESYQTKNLMGVTMGAETSADMFHTAPMPAVEHGMPEDFGNELSVSHIARLFSLVLVHAAL